MQKNPDFLAHALLDSDHENEYEKKDIYEIDANSNFCVKYEKHIYCFFTFLIIGVIVLFVFANS
jgi:hypothetical protein